MSSPTSRRACGAPERSQATTAGSGGMGLEDGPYRGIPMAEKTSGNRRNSVAGSKVVAADRYVKGAATRMAPSRASLLAGPLWNAGVEENLRVASTGLGAGSGKCKVHLIFLKVISTLSQRRRGKKTGP